MSQDRDWSEVDFLKGGLLWLRRGPRGWSHRGSEGWRSIGNLSTFSRTVLGVRRVGSLNNAMCGSKLLHHDLQESEDLKAVASIRRLR